MGTPVVVKIVRVSGTIRKAEEDVIRRAKLIVRRAKAADSASGNHMMDGVGKAVDKRRDTENAVLAQVDRGSESESE